MSNRTLSPPRQPSSATPSDASTPGPPFTRATRRARLPGLLAERILAHYAEARERYAELMADPVRIDRIVTEGAERIRPIAQATMDEVHDKMGLR